MKYKVLPALGPSWQHMFGDFGVQVLLYPDGEVGSNEDSQTRQNKFLANLICNSHIWLDME